MKNNPFVAVSAAVLAMSAVAATNVTAQTIPAKPDGVLSASPTIVQTGTKPKLTWSILYPGAVGGGGGTTEEGGGGGGTTGGGTTGGTGGGKNGSDPLVIVQPPGTLIPTQTVYAEVRIVGTSVTACDSTQDKLSLNTEASVSFNGGAYQQLFYGKLADVNPTQLLYVKKMEANQTLNFGGRYVKNDAWTPFYTTKKASRQVIALVNGDTPPTAFPLYQSATLASYLKPYLDSAGKVKIGPLSVLVVMELGQTDRSKPCYDLQDQVLLVTFSSKHPNNGHGNDLDGVDSSNPGNGSGGPNGGISTDELEKWDN